MRDQNEYFPMYFICRFSCSLLLLCTFLTSCFTPPLSLISNDVPPPPDYSQEKYWSSLPWKKDSADRVVKNSSMKDMQSSASVDVFYLHATTYVFGKTWNADLNDTILRKSTDREAGNQASVFNGSCRVYAPRYRLGKMLTYLSTKKRKKRVFELAYQDVKASFLYYLHYYNDGRPFIIAGHSQGSEHGMRLCQDLIEKDSLLRKRMIAAYLPGTVIRRNDFKKLQPCDSAGQTNCFVSWNSMKWGVQDFYGKPVTNAVCVNPLTWRIDQDYASSRLNLGSVPKSFSRIDKGIVDAKCSEGGALWIHPPVTKGKKDYPRGSSYHSFDYHLFYMNIRENVKQRVDAYLGGELKEQVHLKE